MEDGILRRGNTFGKKYSIRDFLAHGRTSIVYEAVHNDLKRRVALKILKTSLDKEDESLRRLRREGQILANIPRHESLVAVHSASFVEVNQGEIRPYIEMDLVLNAVSSRQFLNLDRRSHPVNSATAWQFLEQLVFAVQHLHQNAVEHRNLNFDSVLIDANRRVRLAGFGRARICGPSSDTTFRTIGEIGLTLPFASPEALTGDARKPADVYALGAMMYQVKCGRPVFSGSAQEMVRCTINEAPPNTIRGWRKLSNEWQSIIRDCLEKRPGDRPTMDELATFFRSQEDHRLENRARMFGWIGRAASFF